MQGFYTWFEFPIDLTEQETTIRPTGVNPLIAFADSVGIAWIDIGQFRGHILGPDQFVWTSTHQIKPASRRYIAMAGGTLVLKDLVDFLNGRQRGLSGNLKRESADQ